MDLDIEIETLLPDKRKCGKKVMPGEISQDEVIVDTIKTYEIQIHNAITDAVILYTNLEQRNLSNIKN